MRHQRRVARRQRGFWVLVLSSVLALATAGCGGDDDDGNTNDVWDQMNWDQGRWS